MTTVEVRGGKWRIDVEDIDGESRQWMRWWHGEGKQSMTVRGVKRKQGTLVDSEEDVGYLEQCWQRGCSVM